VEVPKVSFTAMSEATKEDFDLIAKDIERDKATLPGVLLDELRKLSGIQNSLQVTRLEHSLQSATRAYRDKRDEEYVVAALLHDIGDVLAPYSHGPVMAAVLKPFMSPRMCWIIEKHPLFQSYYYAHLMGADRNGRDKYKDHPFYDDCAEFCARYDQNCFDPNFESLPVEFFEPMVHRIFGRKPQYLASVS
jgi:predicted HD phosphohydrolase